MRFLLDTQIWLWMNAEPARLGEHLIGLLVDPANERLLSAASVWEIGIKHALGKLPLLMPPSEYVPARLASTVTFVLSIEMEHALRASALPHHHRDPFDRMIVAQAQVEGLTVVTVDPAIKAYEVAVLPA